MSEPLINTDEIHEIVRHCLYLDDEIVFNSEGTKIIPVDAVIADGITVKFAFHPVRLESHRARVAEFLQALPESFQASGGGGMSFLNACVDRNDVQWGEHRNMEELFCLGLALRLCKCLMPQDMWNVLPGGIPYYVVVDQDTTVKPPAPC